MNKENKIIFEEIQKPRQIWVQLLVISYTLYLSFIMIKQVVFHIPFKPFQLSNAAIIAFWLIFGMGVLILFYVASMTTQVREDGLYIKYFPFHTSFIKIYLDEIEGYKVITYNPIKDYGGWGIRYGRNGNAFNVSGNWGVELEFKEGRNLLIGSQKPEELAQAIAKII